MTTRAVAALSAATNLCVLCGCTDELCLCESDHAVPASDAAAVTDSGLGASDASFASDGTTDAFADLDQTATVPPDAPAAAPEDVVAADLATEDALALQGAPLIFAPTTHGFGLNAVVRTGDASRLRAYIRAAGAVAWTETANPVFPAGDIAQWTFDGLNAGTLYEYKIAATQNKEEIPLFSGKATTQREAGESFAFALLTDSHIAPRDVVPAGVETSNYMEETLLQVASDLRVGSPDFMIHLGDMLDFHQFGFNDPPPDGFWTRLGYLNYRRLLGDTLGNTSHFLVIGNWDGENGCFTTEEIDRSRGQRLLYVPGPKPETYPEGGSGYEDYYAFTWGDALFVVLNVMTYTPAWHLLGGDPGLPDDWTLGETQLAWLQQTLENATSKWRFVFIHHPVGGAAGNDANSAYGRGGGQAAHVGEQETVHALMLEHGVQIFFYGHDHVFTDMLVDGIHYTLPGSAGAPWKFTEAETGYTQYWSDSGHGRVEVSPDAVHVTFVALGGELIHLYTVE
jgi:hypothetical protein